MKVSRAFLALALCAASMHGAQAVHSGANVRTNALESESFAMQSGVCEHKGCSKISSLNRKEMNDCKCDRAATCADKAAEEIVHKHTNPRTIKQSLEISLSKKYAVTVGGKQNDGNDDLSGCTGFLASEDKSAQAYARIALSLYELSEHDKEATRLINDNLKNHPDIQKEVEMRLAMLKDDKDENRYLPGDTDTDGCAKAFKLIKEYYALVSNPDTPQEKIHAQQDALRANLEFTPGRFSIGAKRDLAACTKGEKGKAALFKIAEIINDIMLEHSGKQDGEATFLKQKVQHTSDAAKDIILAQLKAFDLHPAYKLQRANEVLLQVKEWAEISKAEKSRAETANATAGAPETAALAAADAAREVLAAKEAVVQQLVDQQKVQGLASTAVFDTKVTEIRARMKLVLAGLLDDNAMAANQALEKIIEAIAPLVGQAEAAAASKAQARAEVIKTAAGEHLAEANRLRTEAEGFKAQVDTAETSDAAKNPQQELARVVEALKAVLQKAEATEREADALFHGTVERAKIQDPLRVLGSEVAAEVLKIRTAVSGAETAQSEGAQRIENLSLKERREAVELQYQGVIVPLQDMRRELPLVSLEDGVARLHGKSSEELETAYELATRIEREAKELEGPIKALQANPDVQYLDPNVQLEIQQLGVAARVYRETVDKYEDEVKYLYFETQYRGVGDCLKLPVRPAPSKIDHQKDIRRCTEFKLLEKETRERRTAEREALAAAAHAKTELVKLNTAAASIDTAETAEAVDAAILEAETAINAVRSAQTAAETALGKLSAPPHTEADGTVTEQVQDLFTKKAQKAVESVKATATEAEEALHSAKKKAGERKRVIAVPPVKEEVEGSVEVGAEGGVSDLHQSDSVVSGSGSPKRTLPEGGADELD